MLRTAPRGGDVDDEPEVEMLVVEPRHQSLRRLADHRKDPDHVARRAVGCARGFQAKRRDDEITQGKQPFDPARLPRHHRLGGVPRIEVGARSRDAERVDELRAGEQRGGIHVRRDLVDPHLPSLRASRRKRKTRRVA
ncbi:hypothetical protein ACVWY5_007758 [Bradyrhizobium sp. USDA 3256]